MKEYNTMDDFDFRGKTVLLRVDINCPLDKDTLELEDDNRIRQVIPTIKELLDKRAKVVIIAHQGRPGDWDFCSLEKHSVPLSKYLGQEVRYIDDIVGEEAVQAIKSLEPGQVILLKNVRELPYEQEKKSMEEHAQCELVTKLAPLFDYYINDAFATAHRSQCSLIGFPAVLPSAAGRLMEKELTALTSIFSDPKHPSVFILGGAKFGDSIKVIDRVIKAKIADWVILTGLSALAFLHARGVRLGEPSMEALGNELTPENLEAAKKVMYERGDNILLPFDVAIEVDGRRKDILVGDLPVDYPILDIGRQSVAKFAKVIASARTILMSGPAGMIEKEDFAWATRELMGSVVHAKAFTMIGGGHTVGAAEHFGLVNSFSYVSTAGGALETYLLGKPLPAVEALKSACRKR